MSGTHPSAFGRARPARIAGRVAGMFLLAGAALVGRPAHAADDPPGRVGRITESHGQAWQFDPEGGEWLAVQRNRPVTSGDRLSVENGGRLELRIGSTVVRLDGATELEIERLDDERIELQLHSGSAALRVRSPEVAREVAIDTAEGRFAPRRAGHYRVDRRDDTSFATTWSGELRFEARDSVLNVPAGRSAEFWQEGAQRTTHYSWVEPQRDAFADWAAAANLEDDRSASTRYVSPEMTGWEDLDHNGRWDTHPEYGALWIPTVVVADWAPYRYGHWAWVRPWGWTWIDDAPWGFAPFHYGRWVMWGGRWCWAPGRWVARPVYAPALVAWVGGPALHGGITVGGPPVVGWVPLAPRDVYRPTYPRAVSAVYLRGVNAGHRHLHPDPVRTVPTGPIMYGNQGVPNAVTVVPSNVLTARRPVAPALAQVDAMVRNNLARQPVQRPVQPPAPPTRVVAVPGGAVPVPPPGARPTPTPPQVNDLRRDRERLPQRPNAQLQPGQPPVAQPSPQSRPAPAQPAAQGGGLVNAVPKIMPAQPTPVQPVTPPRDRRSDDSGSARRDADTRVPPPAHRSAPVRIEPPRGNDGGRAPDVAPPARPQPPHAAAAQRPPMPVAPPAVREAPRPPAAVPPPAVREVQRPPAAPAVREVQRVPQHPQPRAEPDGRGRGDEPRGPQGRRNVYQ